MSLFIPIVGPEGDTGGVIGEEAATAASQAPGILSRIAGTLGKYGGFIGPLISGGLGFLSGQWLSPPRTQNVNTGPGSQNVDGGGGGILGSLGGILPIFLILLLLPNLLGGGRGILGGGGTTPVTIVNSPQ